MSPTTSPTHPATTLSVVAMIRTAFRPKSLLPTTIGLVKGGAIPSGAFVLYHDEMHDDPWQWKGVIVLGCLLYSMRTVYGWCKRVFRRPDGESDTVKALGWCVGIEGLMTFSSTPALQVGALVLLVLVNAIATGVSLAIDDQASEEADRARRQEQTEAGRVAQTARDVDLAREIRAQAELAQEIRAQLEQVQQAQAAQVTRESALLQDVEARLREQETRLAARPGAASPRKKRVRRARVAAASDLSN